MLGFLDQRIYRSMGLTGTDLIKSGPRFNLDSIARLGKYLRQGDRKWVPYRKRILWENGRLLKVQFIDERGFVQKSVQGSRVAEDFTDNPDLVSFLRDFLDFYLYDYFSDRDEVVDFVMNPDLEIIGEVVSDDVYSVFSPSELREKVGELDLDLTERDLVLHLIRIRQLVRRFSPEEESILGAAEVSPEYVVGSIYPGYSFGDLRDEIGGSQWSLVYIPVLDVPIPLRFGMKLLKVNPRNEFLFFDSVLDTADPNWFVDLRLKSPPDRPIRGIVVYCDNGDLLIEAIKYIRDLRGTLLPHTTKVFGVCTLWI